MINFRILLRRSLSSLLTDKHYLQVVYYLTFKRKLNLKEPKYWTEKIQYKKLYDRRDKISNIADKILIREYSKEVLGQDILPELYWVGDNPQEIPYDILPKSFVVKTNHGAGTNIIVYDKEKINKEKVERKIQKWLKKDYYSIEKEWGYKNINRKVFVEKLYLNEDNVVPKDIKLYMFSGKLGALNIHSDRFEQKHENIMLDSNFIDLYDKKTNRNDLRPQKFGLMLDYAEQLSKDFDFVRVDFYDLGKNVLLGEMTNYPMAGFKRMPIEVDEELGNMWKD